MEEAEPHGGCEARLRAEFDVSDASACGSLDHEQVTALCRKLRLHARLLPALHALLHQRQLRRVNFEEFKDVLVSVLSHSLDAASEEDGSYLEPAVPEEVKPKFVKGSKRYGRRTRPDNQPGDSPSARPADSSPPSGTEASDSSPAGVRRAKLRRSTSLDSVESLKSDEEVGGQKAVQIEAAQQEEAAAAAAGSCGRLHPQEVDVTPGGPGAGVSLLEFQKGLRGSAPSCCSTPVRVRTRPAASGSRLASDGQPPLVSEERPLRRPPSPSPLTPAVGPRVLSQLDDGSGGASPEKVAALWTEEGIRNGRDILQTLDFPLEERLSLADLTLALDNELLVSGSAIHQVALISYKAEIQHLQVLAEQASRERDKVKVDLELADQRNLQLVREVDDRHASMETLNRSRIRELEQDYRERVASLRRQAEQESETLLQQVEQDRDLLQEDLLMLRAREAELQEELAAAAQENQCLEQEMAALKLSLSEAQGSVGRLQRNLDQLLQDKGAAGPNPEEHLHQAVELLELRCRELRDRNDELSSELELLRSHRKWRRSAGGRDAARSRNERRGDGDGERDSDDPDMKQSSSADRKELHTHDTPVSPAPPLSIQTELAMEQLKQKHQEELQQLHIQLETQVNYYERSLELMRQNMEVERKDICQAFKLEISELEEQKAQEELRAKQLKEALEKIQLQGHAAGGRGSEQERRAQRERAELEQNFAREIGNLVQRLSAEKDQLEAELKLKMDREVLLVREEAERRLAQMKPHHAEGRRRLLHRLHPEPEKKRLQEEVGQSEAGAEESEEEVRSDGEPEESEKLDRRLMSEKSRGEEAARRSLENPQEDGAGERACRKADRTRPIQDLKEQVTAAEELRLRLEEAEEELRRSRTSEGRLKEVLDREREEAERLSQEKSGYTRLAEQLTTQILEMEEEISSLRDHLRELSSRLNHTADLVPDLRRKLNSRTAEADRLRAEAAELALEARTSSEKLRASARRSEELSVELERAGVRVLDLERALLDSRERLRASEEDVERDKRRMTRQLLELEQLVLVLEDQMDPAGRTQLEDLRSDKDVLTERLHVLQQQLHGLEDQVDQKRRRLEEAELQRERWREEEEKLQRENAGYREEVLGLSGRNLQLSHENGELSGALLREQHAVRDLTARLEAASEERGALVRRIQDAAAQKEAELRQQQETWKEDTCRLEEELSGCRVELIRLSRLEAELQSASHRRELLQEENLQLQRDGAERRLKVEALQDAVASAQAEAELLRSQLLSVRQEKMDRDQEVTELQKKLHQAQTRVEELEDGVQRLQKEKDQLQRAQPGQRDQNRQLGAQNLELQHKVLLLQEEQLRSQKLEEQMKLQEEQSCSHLHLQQEQYEKAAAALQRRCDDLDGKLKGVRLVLQEKVQQLKQEMEKNAKSSSLLKDVYVENSQLMAALQVTEQRQKSAERRNVMLDEKVGALLRLLRDLTRVSLAT